MKQDSSPDLDRLDLAIIKELEVDARQTITALAKKLGTSKATARRRLQRLIDQHIIRVIAVVDPPVIGFRTMAMIGINAQPGKVDAVADRLASHGNVYTVQISAGRYDILAWVLFKSPEDLSSFLRNDLGQIQGIARTETMITLEMKKRSFKYVLD